MRALGIFARAPIPGRVKTRLAEDVGPSTAAELYWQVGRRVVTNVAGSGYRTLIWFTPPNEGAFVREWLEGLGRVELRAQGSGTLGERLVQAFARHFADGARRAIVVGTDCPGMERRHVVEAFAALDGHDVVLGPTQAGRVYLIGLREPQPALFRGVHWSSAAVLSQLRARTVDAHLAPYLLRPLREVATLQDARVLGLLRGGSNVDGT
ncbi:MAG TPA: TIGR04282 family arsenosugar biosynthesis glycosyltransferase [Gemmatimonadales bacterium]|nr:TIGR04282 family arsenosugar biosynthesis glycosyltransferase [Gemmatimonadales bacterium]